jgi:hypothetical protein
MALALGTRRSTVAAVVSVFAAMAFAAAVAGRSCRVTTPGPEVAVRDLLAAAKAGDRDAIFELLTDLISIGASDGVAAPTDITVIEQQGDRATVEVVSPNVRARIDVVRSDGRWLVDLPQFGGT